MRLAVRRRLPGEGFAAVEGVAGVVGGDDALALSAAAAALAVSSDHEVSVKSEGTFRAAGGPLAAVRAAVVHVDEAEPRVAPLGPFEIVKEGPVKVSPDVRAAANGAERRLEVPGDEFDARLVVQRLVEGRVRRRVGAHAVLGDVHRRIPVSNLDVVERLAQTPRRVLQPVTRRRVADGRAVRVHVAGGPVHRAPEVRVGRREFRGGDVQAGVMVETEVIRRTPKRRGLRLRESRKRVPVPLAHGRGIIAEIQRVREPSKLLLHGARRRGDVRGIVRPRGFAPIGIDHHRHRARLRVAVLLAVHVRRRRVRQQHVMPSHERRGGGRDAGGVRA